MSHYAQVRRTEKRKQMVWLAVQSVLDGKTVTIASPTQRDAVEVFAAIKAELRRREKEAGNG